MVKYQKLITQHFGKIRTNNNFMPAAMVEYWQQEADEGYCHILDYNNQVFELTDSDIRWKFADNKPPFNLEVADQIVLTRKKFNSLVIDGKTRFFSLNTFRRIFNLLPYWQRELMRTAIKSEFKKDRPDLAYIEHIVSSHIYVMGLIDVQWRDEMPDLDELIAIRDKQPGR